MLVAGAAFTLLPGVARAAQSAPPLRLVVVDNDTAGARNSYRTFLEALNRRFVNAPTRFETIFLQVPIDPAENRRPLLMKNLVALHPDIIFASNQEYADTCASLNTGKPIIFFSTVDPVSSGLTNSLTRPSRGMTGFTLGSRIALKRREMLLRLAPRCKVMGLLSSADMTIKEGRPQSSGGVQEPVSGVEQRRFNCETVAQLEALVRSAAARAVDAWDVEYTVLPYQHAEETVRCFNQLRRPVIYPRMKHLQMGGMAAYVPKIEESDDVWVSQLASLLAGVPIENIPIVQSTRYSFGLNLKACHRMGVIPSKALIKIADVVIE